MTTVGQSEGTVFIRYSGSSIKKPIKISATEGLVALLERSVQAFSLESDRFMEKYSLMWQGKPVDLATCLRYSPVPFGSTLELVRRAVKFESGKLFSMIPLCLQEMETNQRYKLEVNSLNVTLLELLLLFEREFSIQIFDRKSGHLPVLHINGNSYQAVAFPRYTLAVAGGRNALLRLTFEKSSENIGSLLKEAKDKGIESFLLKPTISSNPSCTSENILQSVGLAEEPIPNREFTILPQLPHNDVPSETDSFFQLTAQELQQQYNKQIQDSTKRQNAPLQSARLLSEKKEQKLREKYKECVVRFRFDDNSAIDATFQADEKICQLYKFIEKQKSISRSLLSIPGQIDNLLPYQDATLFGAGLVPRALVIVKELS